MPPAIAQALILGCGYTGRRVAARLLERGIPVLATTRHPERLHALAAAGATVRYLDVLDEASVAALRRWLRPGARALHSIPVVRGDKGWVERSGLLLGELGGCLERVVYLSTTGVYGDAFDVDENTPPAPRNAREKLRVAAEQAVAAGPWSWMVLRPAAIYGPGRGVHEAIRQGTHKLAGDGSNYVSRIHVEDLAEIAAAALPSGMQGAWPVADDEPCPAMEIARFCAALLGVPAPEPGGVTGDEDTRRANRRVDGRAVRRALGITLAYPSYRIGIPAAIAAGLK